MFSLRKAFVISTLVLGAWTSPHTPDDDKSLINWDAFHSLLDTIDPAALHSVLHQLSPKFQDGVFSKDRAAIEHVHSENPVIASKLVHLAKKRQDSNSTTTRTSSSSSSEAASISSILSSEILASTVPGATTITVPPSTPASATAVATSDGGVVYSTFGGGMVTLTSSAVGVRFTPSTSTHLYYTTAADGSVETRTSVVVVNAPVTGATDATGAAGAAATTGSPGLQNAASSQYKTGSFVMALLGVAGWFFAL
ncbi:uncharacterized protein PV06_08527 [Exophiala oligosperma]|uniref:FAS1 domain-containing protein n=2 Tax=Chaetothyriales TaxID=34395 RepID=A0A0D2DA37_9EURO|nr:uncharacterized protein PV06_08527 [Exophiala oligosperma]KAJ9634019.1 hypothetical protein H2204_006567 [Knufia peltigerae]KIW39968.1 hypothetical protein PV06_08527 [Exophiala oligosperma]